MSEFTGTRCDACTKLVDVLPIQAVEDLHWEEDDYGGHTCSDCLEVRSRLEAEVATVDDISVFGETLTEAADAILESPEVQRVKEFERFKEQTLQDLRKDMKRVGATDEQIEEMATEVEEELDLQFNQKYNLFNKEK
jgi:hypothetical protein